MVTFSDTLAGISTLTQWTPCSRIYGACDMLHVMSREIFSDLQTFWSQVIGQLFHMT